MGLQAVTRSYCGLQGLRRDYGGYKALHVL